MHNKDETKYQSKQKIKTKPNKNHVIHTQQQQKRHSKELSEQTTRAC